MKVSFALLAGLLLVGGLHTEAHASGVEAKDAQILGYWQRGEGEAIIEVRRDAGVYQGVIVSSERRPETVGIAIFDHPSNPRHPTWWMARSYGYVGANPFGIHAFEGKPKGTGDFRIKSGESATFRYRFVFHEGDPDQAKIAERYARYAKSSVPKPGAAKRAGR